MYREDLFSPLDALTNHVLSNTNLREYMGYTRVVFLLLLQGDCYFGSRWVAAQIRALGIKLVSIAKFNEISHSSEFTEIFVLVIVMMGRLASLGPF